MRSLFALPLCLMAVLASCGPRSARGPSGSVGAVATEYTAALPDRRSEPTALLSGSGPIEDERSRAMRLTAELPTLSVEMRAALERQRGLLERQRRNRRYELGGRVVSPRELIQVIDALLSGRFRADPLAAIPVTPGGAVHFTGYYSPEVDVHRDSTAEYRYPILEHPATLRPPYPSRREIELGGAIDFQRHAIAWARHPLDVYALQLQGSGFIRFPEGQRSYLAYGGTNRYPYQSIELALQRVDPDVEDLSLRGLRDYVDAAPRVRDTITTFNPNYGFFERSTGEARGAVGLPLSPMISVAADPRHYPLGSVLLARVPVPGHPGSYRTQLLLVQDTGGAIRGKSHLDLYTGVGERALDLAEVLSTVGEVYVLGPPSRVRTAP